MQNRITTQIELQNAINLLEIKQIEAGKLLKQEISLFTESIKPYNIIKKTILDFKEDLISQTIGQSTGYMADKIMVGETKNPIKKLIGAALRIGVSSIASNNFEPLKAIISDVVSKIITPKNIITKPKSEHNY